MSATRSSSPRPGERLEKVVARIQALMDPLSTVLHNERLVDRVGNTRQYDVVIRGQFGGRAVLGIIECKDHSRRKGPDAIEAFAKKTENLGANLRVVVSRRGFTPQALLLAKHEHIGCVSLLPGPEEQLGFTIGEMWYGTLNDWQRIRLGFEPSGPAPTFKGFNPYELLVDGLPAINWFIKELQTKYRDVDTPGDHTLTVTFGQPIAITVCGQAITVSSLSATAERIVKKKRRWVSWSGDALYDWHAGSFTLPAGGLLFGSAVETDLSLWPDDPGPDALGGVGTSPSFIRFHVVTFPKWNAELDPQVPDLASL